MQFHLLKVETFEKRFETRMHSSRMRTARSSSRPGGGVVLHQAPPGPGNPPVNRMTDRCKNIPLPQTSFAGGNEENGNAMLTSQAGWLLGDMVS